MGSREATPMMVSISWSAMASNSAACCKSPKNLTDKIKGRHSLENAAASNLELVLET